jgi:hypothetical protein
LQTALRINPDDAIARQSLERIKRIVGEPSKGQR